MRKIIMLGTLIALFGGGALAYAENAASPPASATEATRPAARGEEYGRERHHDSRREYHEVRRGDRDHHDDDRDHRDEGRHHGRQR